MIPYIWKIFPIIEKGEGTMKRKSYHQFSFTNDYVFAEVMKDPKLCKQLIRCILPDREIKELRLCEERVQGTETKIGSEVQRDISFNARSKGIRLDVLFRDDEAWYNIEMQCSRHYDIPLRARYYGGLIDLDQLNKGDSYVRLRNTYVIFICTFDMFQLGEPIYFFQNYDINNRLKFNDRSYRIIVNTRSKKADMPQELKVLFDYINEASVDESDLFIRELDRQVTRLNTEDNDWRREVMRLDEEFALREMRAREEARKAAQKTMAARLLKKGMPTDEIAEVTDMDAEEIEACRE